ncbi:unnamed protein product [Alopecurus aequalis]
MSAVTPSSETEPRRSTRPRSRPAPYADADAGLERPKRQRRAAGKAGSRRKNAAKGKPKPVGASRMMEVDDAGGAIIDDDMCGEEPDAEEMQIAEEEAEEEAKAGQGSAEPEVAKMKRVARPSTKRRAGATKDRFVGEPIPADEARRRWPDRYKTKVRTSDREEQIGARRHYRSACVEDTNFNLGDDVYVKAGPKEEDYIGRITEFFEGTDLEPYFSCHWFFRVADTVISPRLLSVQDHKHDRKRVFLSEEKDDNIIGSIISRVNIIYVAPNISPEEKLHLISKSDLYYDMSYSVACSTFTNLPAATSDISCADADTSMEKPLADLVESPDAQTETATLLDLYSGCGAMSTGLCLGAALSGIKLNTKWAVDMNTDACDSLKENHPHTQVRNEKADDFLSLLRQWDALCKKYGVQNSNNVDSDLARTSNDDEDDDNGPLPKGTFEVEKLVDICYGDPNSTENVGLWFKVRWKTYDDSHDTWEPIDGLCDSNECIKEFVESGYRESILPLPGCVDVICGGPPCQGISGLNRFRNSEAPLEDERNKQLGVFMDIVNYLRPKYVLMENVVDLLKFADGFLGRYALSRLVAMNYQARLGMMVAGCYGLPQFRMRAFLWGAVPSVVLPKFPLPTHHAVSRGVVPNAFSQCLVTYDKTEDKHLKPALVLDDALSDLPKVQNNQPKDVLDYYGTEPNTDFQRYIRLNRKDMKDYSSGDATPKEVQLFDHQPLKLNSDDYERVQKIPVKKGANFRDLEGVRVGEKNKVEFVPDMERVLLSSGKPLVPNYAMTFCKGRSLKPFGRLWWDETVSTVVTRAEPHNQIILHPEQDRVLTVRENARLQGFPDYYKLSGPIKQKYMQVGNAVAVPVARALGYSLGQAYQGEFHGDNPLFELPANFIPKHQGAATRLSEGTSGDEVVEEE